MSRTTLYAADDKGVLREVAEFHNASHSAQVVWEFLLRKYFPEAPRYTSLEWLEKLCAYEESGGAMESWERIVLRATYDLGLVLAADAPEAIDAFWEFHEQLRMRGTLSSLAEQAQAMEVALRGGATAFAWHQTSVSEWPWSRYDEDTDRTFVRNALSMEWEESPSNGEDAAESEPADA